MDEDLILEGWIRLVCAVIYRAYQDVLSGNGYAHDARRFLESDGCAFVLEDLGISHERVLSVLPEHQERGQLRLPGL